MLLAPVGEKSFFNYTFSVQNVDGEALVPDSVEYRIDCLTTRQTVLEPTVIVPAEEMTIAVAPADNVIVDDSNSRELKQLTIIVNGGTATQFVPPDPVQWYVTNVLPGRSVLP